MFQKTFINSIISGLYFGFSGLLGIIFVPLLILEYGTYGFGLIVLIRSFLPTGTLGLLDFGINEISTNNVSIGVASNNWAVANARIIVLSISAIFLGMIAAVLLFSYSNTVTEFLNVKPEDHDLYNFALELAAIVLPILFVSLVFEGVIKGFENFSALRAVEAFWLLIHSGLVLIFLRNDMGFQYVIYSLLGCLTLKSCFMISIALYLLPRATPNFQRKETFHFLRERAAIFFTARLLSAFQHQAPPILIGIVFGPGPVGIYDALLKIPRFLKSACGILVSVIIPKATQLDATNNKSGINALSQFLVGILPISLVVPFLSLAIFSKDIVNLWLGQNFIEHSIWLALYLVVPLTNTFVGFQNSVLINRPDYLRKNNFISGAVVVVQYAISFAFIRYLDHFAFIFGQSVALALAFAFQVRIANQYLELNKKSIVRFVSVFLVCMSFCAIFIFVQPDSLFKNIWSMLLALALTNLIGMVFVYLCLLKPDERLLLKLAAMSVMPKQLAANLRDAP